MDKNTKELNAMDVMLNDWVMVNGKPRQLRISDLVDWMNEKIDFEAIQLTEDDFIANGFIVKDLFGDMGSYFVSQDGRVEVTIEGDYFGIHIDDDHAMTCAYGLAKYVNEAQQIFRVGKKKDMGDNFKIKLHR